MKKYLKMCAAVLFNGVLRTNRTATPAISTFGGELSFDLSKSFPLPTTKAINFKSVMAELVGFLNGATSAADFRQLGTKIWDKNANTTGGWLRNPHRKGTDDLGPIYGSQWRRWESVKLVTINQHELDYHNRVRMTAYMQDGYVRLGEYESLGGITHVLRKEIDQFAQLIDGIKNNPYDRAHMVTAWNPGVQNEIALRPCHTFFQCYVRDGGFLDLKMYQRSADMFLGVPFNIASYAALAHLIAHLTDLRPGVLTITFGDAHIYENHKDALGIQFGREEREGMAQLTINLPSKDLNDLTPDSFELVGYVPDPAISAPMAE